MASSPGTLVIRLRGWRALGDDEPGEELSAWLLAAAPNQALDGDSVALDRVGIRELTHPAKGWRILGMQRERCPPCR